MKNVKKVERNEENKFEVDLGKRLATLRAKKGYTLKKATQKLQQKGFKYSHTTLNHYECAESIMDIFTLSILAEFYGVSTDFLLYGTESTPDQELTRLLSKVPQRFRSSLIKIMETIIHEFVFSSAES